MPLIPKSTEEQSAIIAESGKCIIIAKPGSGKTYTISQKIRQILPTLPSHRGVIAISFTNKASDELERRCLADGLDGKVSFWGTIDKFQIREIILPFAGHVWGRTIQEVEIVKIDDIEQIAGLQSDFDTMQYERMEHYITYFKTLYEQGKIILETIGFLGLYIFNSSYACRRYLKARYSHVFVDEYQDCDFWQHSLFIQLSELGLCGVAVGDPAQSIFAFAGKNSKYLTELAQIGAGFKVYSLSINHRCHDSIIYYSTRLLSETFEPISYPTQDKIQVYEKWVEGTEIEIVHWLPKAIDFFCDKLRILNKRNVAVLVKNNGTAHLIHQNIGLPHKLITSTVFDKNSSLWSSLFQKVLNWVFDPEITKHEIVEKYLDIDFQPSTVRQVMHLLNKIERIALSEPSTLIKSVDNFFDIANLIFPNKRNELATNNLVEILGNSHLLASFMPAQANEVQLLTLHKSKGLEFDLVFHLDMYQYILPKYKSDLNQEVNLHYVGITRARKCCVLCGSTKRHNYENRVLDAQKSEFFDRHNLSSWRSTSPI